VHTGTIRRLTGRTTLQLVKMGNGTRRELEEKVRHRPLLEMILFMEEECHSMNGECQPLDKSEHPNVHRNTYSRTRIEYLYRFALTVDSKAQCQKFMWGSYPKIY
jgi:hypothetical protein